MMPAWSPRAPYGPLGVSGEVARTMGPHVREAIRDIARCCSCRWTWDLHARAYVRLIPVGSCTWHAARTGPVADPPTRPPTTIPLATDKTVARRMAALRDQMRRERGRAVAWHEVLELLLDVYDETLEGEHHD
jgi:hypothetical protein